jgi:rhodanese-related sulfurtransferase
MEVADMRWKQFFTRVNSLDVPEAKKFMDSLAGDQFTLLDVRQPGEYETGHLPGSKLIPLPELSDRIAEIDPAKPTVVY